MTIDELQYKASSGTTITYVEDPYPVQNENGKEKLVVIFQSLGNEKSDDPRERFPYTLIAGLKFYNCRKIYIKDDYDHVGCYYLGTHGKFNVYDAVLEFLDSKISEYNLSKDGVIFYGNSKGAYASLLFGYKIGVKNIVAAIPQYRLCDWIEQRKPFLRYIMPDEIDESVRFKYNNILRRIIDNSHYKPDVYLVTSKRDETFSDDAAPLIEKIREKGSRLYVYMNDGKSVTKHGNVVINSMNEILTILGMLISKKDMSQFFDREEKL